MAVMLLSTPQAVPGFQFMVCWLIMQCLLFKSVETVNCSAPTTESLLSALKESIFNKTEIRPVLDLKTPSILNVSFTLYGILGVDEKAQKLKTFLWVELIWNIEGLSWDPVECGTDRISLPRKKLWRPDIVISQFIDFNRAPDTYYLYVSHQGKVFDGIPLNLKSSCNLDIYTFPFDIQNCSFTFNSYQHTVLDIQLFFAEPVEKTLHKSLTAMTTKGEWELVNMHADKNTIPPDAKNVSSDKLNYYVVLRRRPTMYIVNLLIPSCFLITVDLFSFLLPPHSTDRSAFKMTLILGYTVFLLLMNDLLPTTGSDLPLINVFFSLCFALMVASLLETIVITNILCGSTHFPSLPHWANVLFLHYVAKLVCLSKKPSDQNCALNEFRTEISRCDPVVKIPQSEAAHKILPTLQKLRKISQDLQLIRQQADQHFNSNESADDWVLLGQVTDRLLFSMYIVFLVVSFITIFVFWLHWYNAHAALI